MRGLNKIITEGLGYMMTHQLDKLARDAFLKAPFALYGPTGTKSNFSQITNTDTVTINILQDIRLGLKERNIPVAVDESAGLGETIWCVTTPGVMLDLRREAAAGKNDTFIELYRYNNPSVIVNGEVGTMHNVRFIETNNAVLYNCGAIIAQANIKAPINTGDGAPDPETTAVDSIEYVGQPDATHHITVDTTTGIEIGDIVTIHVDRTSAHGVTNGVDYTDGKLTNRRVVAKTATTLTFERPIMEDFKTDLGGTIYGYVTKGTNIHTMMFFSGSDGVAMGVAQPPTIRAPRPVDDLDMIQRFTYDMYLGYQPFNKNAYEIVYLAGSNRVVGPRYVR